MFSFKATVQGQLMSKSNSRRLVMFGRRLASIKSAKANAFTESFILQSKAWDHKGWPYQGDVILTARVFLPSRRQDLDDSLLCDCIQKAGILKNDRSIKGKQLFWALDRDKPRVSFWLEEWKEGWMANFKPF